MDCTSILLEPLFSSFRSAAEAGLSFVWNLVAEGVGNHFYLDRNAEALVQEGKELLEERDDLLAQLEALEGPRRRRTHLVKGWLGRAAALCAEVDEFESTFDGRAARPGGRSLGSFHANLRLGTAAAKLLRRVRALKAQRRDLGEVVGPSPPEPVEAVPCSAASIIGGAATLSELRRLLGDDEVRIVGICGMGGVGKTTLLTVINNELRAGGNHGFDVVIWVTVSRDLNVLKIQKQIGDRLGLSLSAGGAGSDSSEQVREQAKTLFRRLSETRKFLLLLDDVWEKLELQEIGIPHPSNQSQYKIMFTTRSRAVCAVMDAKVELKVSCLNAEDSWRLFREKMGAEVNINRRHLRRLVETVVTKCGGLPLALITAARAMAHATTAGEWEEAIELLKDSPEKLSGMEQEVLRLLKFSFDRLQDETLRQCLLYCSLFPEDHNIEVEKLVEYWIGEGFLDARYAINIDRARNRGLVIIRELKDACLLEDGKGFLGDVVSLEENKYVTMHDTVREMCVWLTAGEYDGSNTFLVDAGKGSTEAPGADRWGEAKRISLMHNSIAALPSETPSCPALLTLLLNSNRDLRSIPGTVFGLMPVLRVLDLSFTKLEEIPVEVGLLLQLRCLNLSATKIRAVPKELGELVRLRQLILRGTTHLERIPRGVILKLSNLQMLDLFGSTYEWSWSLKQGEGGGRHDDTNVLVRATRRRRSGDGADGEGSGDGDEEAQLSLNDLERLQRLSNLGLHITTPSCLEGLTGSHILLKSTRSLRVMVPDFGAYHLLNEALAAMDGLRRFQFYHSGEMKGELEIGRLARVESLYGTNVITSSTVGDMASSLLPCLRILVLQQCHSLWDVTWIRHLPSLESFSFSYNDQVEMLLRGQPDYGADPDACSFPRLKEIHLRDLPRLTTISRHPLLFPALEQLHVKDCPELKWLSMGHCSTRKVKEIRGEQEWWDALEWDSPEDATRAAFLPHFRPLGSD